LVLSIFPGVLFIERAQTLRYEYGLRANAAGPIGSKFPKLIIAYHLLFRFP
jgi:hypothetical protein